MIKKYFKYILLTFTVMFLFQLDTFAKAETVNMNVSEVKSNYCKYEYDSFSWSIIQDGDSKIKVGSLQKKDDIYDFRVAESDNTQDSDFYKNGKFTCAPMYVYLYDDAIVGKTIDVSTNTKDQYALNIGWQYKATVNGKLTEYITSCVYRISTGSSFTVNFNPVTKKTFGYKIYNSEGQEALDNRISSSIKKGWTYSDSGLVCRDDIVIDSCPPGEAGDMMLTPVENIHVRTTADKMDTTCTKSTSPGGIKVTEKDTESSASKLLFLSDICEEDAGTMKVVRFIGYLLVIVKILIPIGLIIIGVINFSKAMLSGNDDSIKKNAYSFAWKIVFAIVIFVLPTVINFMVGLIDGATDGTEDYENCRNCIFDPKNCDIPNE